MIPLRQKLSAGLAVRAGEPRWSLPSRMEARGQIHEARPKTQQGVLCSYIRGVSIGTSYAYLCLLGRCRWVLFFHVMWFCYLLWVLRSSLWGINALDWICPSLYFLCNADTTQSLVIVLFMLSMLLWIICWPIGCKNR